MLYLAVPFAVRLLNQGPQKAGELRRGIADAWQIPMPSPKQLMAFGEQFRPHRSIVAWYGYQAAHRLSTTRKDK